MADKKISQLTPATTPLAGTEELPIVQGGSTVKVSVNNLTAGKAVTASQLTVENSTSNDAVRITQTGAGNALVVEDSTNPDSTPFVVDTNGRFIHGYTSALTLRGITWSNLFAGIDASTAGSALARYSANASSAILEFFKSRNASISGNTVVQSGDVLGTLIFSGADGTDFVQGASINASVDGTPGTNDMPGRLVFSTTADGASSPTERMRITNAGNIQLGGGSVATNATNGFPYIPTCAGTPTGTPTAISGFAPMVVDSTNNKLYVYIGGAWKAMN